MQDKSRTSVYQDESVIQKDIRSQDVSNRNSAKNYNNLSDDEDLLLHLENKIRIEVEKVYEEKLESQIIIMKEKTAQEINDFHEKAQSEYEDLLLRKGITKERMRELEHEVKENLTREFRSEFNQQQRIKNTVSRDTFNSTDKKNHDNQNSQEFYDTNLDEMHSSKLKRDISKKHL